MYASLLKCVAPAGVFGIAFVGGGAESVSGCAARLPRLATSVRRESGGGASGASSNGEELALRVIRGPGAVGAPGG